MNEYVGIFVLVFLATVVAVGLLGTFTTGKGKIHFGIPDN